MSDIWADLERVEQMMMSDTGLHFVRPLVYYATSDQLRPGTCVSNICYRVKTPQFFVCHPDDLRYIKDNLLFCDIVPISEYKWVHGLAEITASRIREDFVKDALGLL